MRPSGDRSGVPAGSGSPGDRPAARGDTGLSPRAARLSASPRWHRFVDHTGELGLEIRAESLAGLMTEAARALGLLLLKDAAARTTSPPRIVGVRSRDREALLVDWLNELLYLAETELWVPLEVDILDIADVWLRASVRGVPVAEAPTLIKAATLHGVRIDPHGDGLQAQVLLDV